jgi:hypothetical protein
MKDAWSLDMQPSLVFVDNHVEMPRIHERQSGDLACSVQMYGMYGAKR